MLLFAEELSQIAALEAQKTTILYWFAPEKRFLCERGVLMMHEIPAQDVAEYREGFQNTRVVPIPGEVCGDQIIVRGPCGVREFSRKAIEEKEKKRKVGEAL